MFEAFRKKQQLKKVKHIYALIDAKEFEHAEALVRKEIQRHRDDPVYYTVLADCLGDAGDGVGCEKALISALEIDPGNVTALFARALLYHEHKRYAQALGDVTAALDAGGPNFDLHRLRAIVFDELGHHDQALADYEAMVRLRPGHWEGLVGRAGAKLQMGKVDASVPEDLGAAIRHEPSVFRLRLLRAEAWIELGRPQDALRDLDFVLERRPDDASALELRSRIHGLAGSDDAAATDDNKRRRLRDADVRRVAEKGRFVWAALVQANAVLYESGFSDAPAMVVFTFDRKVPDLGEYLNRVARTVASWKSKMPRNEAEAYVVNLTQHETYVQYRRRPLPENMTEGRMTFCADLMVYRDCLPDGKLTMPFLPCVAEREFPQRIEQLPRKYSDKRWGELNLPAEYDEILENNG